MAKDNGKKTLGIVPAKRVRIGVADAGEVDLHAHLALAWWVDLDVLDDEGLLGAPGDCRLAFDRLANGRHFDFL